MNFGIKSVANIISRANNYLSNACSVQSSESTEAFRSVKRTKDEQLAAEKQIADEEARKIKSATDRARDAISADRNCIDNIVDLNNKLISVDKKYAKRNKAISFAGVSDDLIKQILTALGYKDTPDFEVVKKLYAFYKEKSYRYISKPISPILIASKKRISIYDQLASCLILAQEYIKNNEKYYIDKRDEEIKEIKDDAAQQIINTRKRFEIKMAMLQQNIKSDSEFLVEESSKGIGEIFNDDFYAAFHSVRERAKECFGQVNTDGAFQDEIYIGDIAFNFSDEILSNQIGSMAIENHAEIFEDNVLFLPTTLKISECQSVFVTPNSSSDREYAKNLINQLMYSFLRQLPLNGLEFTVFDPDQRGNSIFPFLNLPTLLPEMFSKKIFTSAEDISNRIAELNQYVDSVIQQKLSNKYDNVYEYNAATPENPLPIKVVCIFDFPKFFEGRAYENLLSIVKNASRCGIFVICCYSPSELRSSYGDVLSIIKEIKALSIGLTQSKEFTIVEGTSLLLSPATLPKQSVLDEFFIQYERACKKKLSEGIPFISVVKDGDFFTKSSAEGISLPVGKGDGSATQFIEFGKRSSQHAVITGATGSGKSTLLHTLIMSAIMNYSPDELNLYLMDFKSGTEFKVYETIKVPHIKLLALDALQEFGESILMELVEEQKRRSQLFKDNGEHTSIKSFVSATGQKMPRILVVMDEFQILFNESSNRKVAQHCAELANKIVTEGRAFGIHLIMATQTLRSIREKTAISNSTIEQMRIRIGLKCGEEDANFIFGDANARDALQKMKGAIGTAVYNPEFTEANNSGFRVAYCPEQEQKSLLTAIQGLCKDKYTNDMKVFEGKRVPEYPVALLRSYQNEANSELVLEIGEPIRIDDPIRIIFSKKKNNNLLLVGSDNNLMARIIDIISLEAAIIKDTNLHYLDGNAFFDEPIDPFIEKIIEHGYPVHTISSRKDCILTIEELYDEFKKRRKSVSNLTDKHVVLINGLQYIDILCSMLKGDCINRDDYIEASQVNSSATDDFDFDSFGSESIDYSSAIIELIELGYSYGFYFVIACNEYQTVRDVLHYGAGILNKLSNRIVFAISDKDCDDLVEGVQLSGMNNISAIFTDGIKRTMQFKPYAVPNTDKI